MYKSEKVKYSNFSDELLEKTLEFFVIWYTINQCKFQDLSDGKKRKLRQIITMKNGVEEIGEFIGCAHLMIKGWRILHANIINYTYGKASERGIDGIFEYKDIPYIVEIKTNARSTSKSYSALKSSAMIQLDKRAKNIGNQIDSVGDKLEEKMADWRDNFEEKREWFIKNYKTLAIILTQVNINDRENRHRLINIIFDRLLDSTSKITNKLFKGTKNE